MFIDFRQVSFSYQGKNSNIKALNNINLSIAQGEFICITGHTGSGKSTLVQHINGLLRPTSGAVYIDNKEIPLKGKALQNLRKQIGMLFQFPEEQLFEETIANDICFALKKLGISQIEIEGKLKSVMDLVGLDYELKDASPFNISGGQKRRVALAGVLITEPSVLILDEPTVGLDPKGKKDVLNIIRNINQKGSTIIMVTHELEDIVEYASRLIVMENGRIVFDGHPLDLLSSGQDLEEIKLSSTEAFHIAKELREMGIKLKGNIVSWKQLEQELIKIWNQKE